MSLLNSYLVGNKDREAAKPWRQIIQSRGIRQMEGGWEGRDRGRYVRKGQCRVTLEYRSVATEETAMKITMDRDFW